MTNQDTIEDFDIGEMLMKQEANASEVDELISKHEKFKAKWLQLTDQDMFDRVALRESMKDKITELKSVYYEEKQQNDVKKGARMVELKAM